MRNNVQTRSPHGAKNNNIMSGSDENESWDRAKSLILGAIDVMMQLRDGKKTDSGSSGSSTGSTSVPGGSSSAPVAHCSTSASTSVKSSNNPSGKSKPSVYNEHRRIFGYQPSKVYSSKRAIKGKGKGKKKAIGTWTKEVMFEGLRPRDLSKYRRKN